MMEYILTREDLETCIKFAINIYFAKGSGASRLTGQTRGLGTMINDWVGGKAIEIGIKNMLEQQSTNKELCLDFSIYQKGRIAEDPDVVKVKENGEERKPKLFLEFKNYGGKERWIGLTNEQFRTIERVIDGDLEKAYLIYASLQDNANDSEKRLDLLGAFLQVATKDEYAGLFDKFVKLGEIKIKIVCILTLKELKDNGTRFIPNEDYVYETNIFVETRQNVEMLEEIELVDYVIPKLNYRKYPYPSKIGDLHVQGTAKMYKKQNKESITYFIKCLTNVVINNEVLGEYKLDEGKVYKLEFGPAGRNPQLFKEVLWISAKKAIDLFGSDKRVAYIINEV